MLKAYYVTDYCEEQGEIVFAETAGKAKCYSNLDCDFIDKKARREKKYDQYVGKGVPKEVLINDGWWFTCEKCFNQVNQSDIDDGGMVINEEVYCHQCAIACKKEGESQ